MEEINMFGLLPLLPGDIGDIETKVVLKKLTKAHQALAESKEIARVSASCLVPRSKMMRLGR
jgi:hypothetical protein